MLARPWRALARRRLTVVASAEVAALDDEGEPLLHVASMERVMTGLLGFQARRHGERRARPIMHALCQWLRGAACARPVLCW